MSPSLTSLFSAHRERTHRARLRALESAARRRCAAKLALSEAAEALRRGGPGAFVAAQRAMRRAAAVCPELVMAGEGGGL